MTVQFEPVFICLIITIFFDLMILFAKGSGKKKRELHIMFEIIAGTSIIVAAILFNFIFESFPFWNTSGYVAAYVSGFVLVVTIILERYKRNYLLEK